MVTMWQCLDSFIFYCRFSISQRCHVEDGSKMPLWVESSPLHHLVETIAAVTTLAAIGFLRQGRGTGSTSTLRGSHWMRTMIGQLQQHSKGFYIVGFVKLVVVNPSHSLFSRLIVRSGNSSVSPLHFDTDMDDVPERGIVSEGSSLYLELTADSSSIPLLLALRYEGEMIALSFPVSLDSLHVCIFLFVVSPIKKQCTMLLRVSAHCKCSG